MFTDRRDAGKKLSAALQNYRTADMRVLALPRGGVPIGYEVARALDAPLDVLVVRKLGVPGQEELAMGAIGPENVVILNEDVIRMFSISQGTVEQVIRQEQEELERRMKRFRNGRPFPDIRGQTIILTDDGLATGATAMAGIRALRALQPARIILAVPVCAADSARTVRHLADELVCLESPPDFKSVGQWYLKFYQMTDEEVLDLLSDFRPVYPLGP